MSYSESEPDFSNFVINFPFAFCKISCLLALIWVVCGGEGGAVILPPPPSLFSLNNSKTVKAVTLEFCRIQSDCIRDIRAKFGIHNSSHSPDIGQNSDGGIFPDFWSISHKRKLS